MADTMIPTSKRLKEHAQDYRDRAANLKTMRQSWITDGIEVRTREYLDLAEYFERLAKQ
jgi:hypothetical protein